METITETLIGAAARRKIWRGVNAVVNAIAPTLGPAGRSAILPRSYNRGPRIADDGYMVAENVQLRDPHERAAADAFKEAIKKTNELVGDGTTSTGIIAGALYNGVYTELSVEDVPTASLEGVKKGGVNVVERAKEMRTAMALVVEEIKKQAKPVKTLVDLEKIAFIAIKDEAVAKTVADMAWKIGRDEAGNFVDNHVDVVEGYKGEIETEVIVGMKFPSKVAHRGFVTDLARYEMVANDVAVLITNYKLDNPFELIRLLERVKAPKIAIFAPEFSTGVLTTMVATVKNGIFCYPIKSPALRTVQMEDLGVYTGARVIDKDTGAKLEGVTASDLGFAEKIVVKDTENREDATLIGGRGHKVKRGESNLVEERRTMLKSQLKEARNDIDRIQLEKRIANLSSAVGVIRVGGATDKETLHMKLKIEDGVFACKAALQEGYVKGGGLCLKEIAEKLPKNALTEALRAPYELIQKNAGGVLEIGKDVIDPAKVVRQEVEHAVSIASTLIQVEVSMPEMREEGPAEGYKEIAKAIDRFVLIQSKQWGLFKESQDMAESDREAAFDTAMHEANK